MRHRHGFTLAELLVVLSVIVLLAAILAPSLTSGVHIARGIICANNLKRICESTKCWAAESQDWHQQALVSAGWTGAVTKYADTKCLSCPEGGTLAEGSPMESQVVIRTSPTSNVAIPLVSLVEGGSFKMLKLSGTQWASIGESKKIGLMPYVPDSNPNVYWWGYDDGAIGTGDYDFQDLAIRVTRNGNGTATLFVAGATSGKPEVWTADLTKPLATWDKINQYYDHGSPGMSFNLVVGEGSHYGMNDAKLDMRMPGKIQAIDYLFTTARSTDDWGNPEWDADGDGQADFLRHGGRLNVLYMDGSVRLQDRREIDPMNVQVERDLWQP